MGWISAERGGLCSWSMVKRLEACIRAEGGHFEHLLWRCFPDIPVATYHSCFFQSHQCQPTTGSFQSHQRFEECNIAFSQMKKFSILQGSAVIFFQVWWVRISVPFQYTGEVGKCTSYWCQIFSGFITLKIVKSVNLWQSYSKNKKLDVFWDTVYFKRGKVSVRLYVRTSVTVGVASLVANDVTM